MESNTDREGVTGKPNADTEGVPAHAAGAFRFFGDAVVETVRGGGVVE